MILTLSVAGRVKYPERGIYGPENVALAGLIVQRGGLTPSPVLSSGNKIEESPPNPALFSQSPQLSLKIGPFGVVAARRRLRVADSDPRAGFVTAPRKPRGRRPRRRNLAALGSIS